MLLSPSLFSCIMYSGTLKRLQARAARITYAGALKGCEDGRLVLRKRTHRGPAARITRELLCRLYYLSRNQYASFFRMRDKPEM